VVLQFVLARTGVMEWVNQMGQTPTAQESTAALAAAIPLLSMLATPMALAVMGLIWAFNRVSPAAPAPEPAQPVRRGHWVPLIISFVLLFGLLVYNTLSSMGLLSF
jgi:hypothetical protein